MPTITQLLQRREAIRQELSSLLNTAPDGNLSDEQRNRADALEAEAVRVTEAERRQAFVDDLDRRAGAGVPVSGASVDANFDRLAASVSALDTIRAQLGATDAGAGRAREVSAELARRSGRAPDGLYWPWRQPAAERRTLGLSTGGGSNLIQTEVAPATIDALRNKSVIIRAGATVLSDLVGNLAIPRLTGSASVGWVADGTGLSQSNPTFDQLSFTPHHCGGIVGISRQVLQQSSPDVARVVENDLAALIATAIDTAAIAGTGGAQPTGILNTSGLPIVSGGTNGLAINWANVQALVGAVENSNALDGRLAFVTNAKVTKSMRQTLKTTSDTSSNFIVTAPAELAGYPLYTTQNVASAGTKGSGTGLSSLIFGDFSSLYIGAWSMLDILANPLDSTAYAAGAVLIRAMATVDVGVRHVAAFAAVTDVIAP